MAVLEMSWVKIVLINGRVQNEERGCFRFTYMRGDRNKWGLETIILYVMPESFKNCYRNPV